MLDMFAEISRHVREIPGIVPEFPPNNAGNVQNDSARTCSCWFSVLMLFREKSVSNVGTFHVSVLHAHCSVVTALTQQTPLIPV